MSPRSAPSPSRGCLAASSAHSSQFDSSYRRELARSRSKLFRGVGHIGRRAQAYGAQCTPEFYVFDKDLRLTYHAQFDDARPNNGKEVTGRDLRAALDATIEGKPPPAAPASIGCNVKWHP